MVRYREYSVSFGPPLTPKVKGLITATAVAFVLTYFPARIAHWGYPYFFFGLRPYLVTHDLFLWQPFTYLFLHAGFFHIIFNLFVLWMFGPDLESLGWQAIPFLLLSDGRWRGSSGRPPESAQHCDDHWLFGSLVRADAGLRPAVP